MRAASPHGDVRMVWRATAAAAATIRRTPPPIASEELPVRVWLPKLDFNRI